MPAFQEYSNVALRITPSISTNNGSKTNHTFWLKGNENKWAENFVKGRVSGKTYTKISSIFQSKYFPRSKTPSV